MEGRKERHQILRFGDWETMPPLDANTDTNARNPTAGRVIRRMPISIYPNVYSTAVGFNSNLDDSR